jgi:hypothetical protein
MFVGRDWSGPFGRRALIWPDKSGNSKGAFMTQEELTRKQNEDRQKEASRMPTEGHNQYPSQYPTTSAWGGGSQNGNGNK